MKHELPRNYAKAERAWGQSKCRFYGNISTSLLVLSVLFPVVEVAIVIFAVLLS
jgi:hypothetical protein